MLKLEPEDKNDKKKQQAITDAEHFCKGVKAEKDLRDAIATIIAKLNRSNLSAGEGMRQAESLVDAYKILKGFE
jgi:hypothetical protein